MRRYRYIDNQYTTETHYNYSFRYYTLVAFQKFSMGGNIGLTSIGGPQQHSKHTFEHNLKNFLIIIQSTLLHR